jgi:hypothetical protein
MHKFYKTMTNDWAPRQVTSSKTFQYDRTPYNKTIKNKNAYLNINVIQNALIVNDIKITKLHKLMFLLVALSSSSWWFFCFSNQQI